MSKKLLLVLLMGFTIIGAKAQSQKHTIGIQGGAFLKRTLTARAYPDAEVNISPAAGIFYRYMFNKRFGAEAGMLYRKEFDKEIYYLQGEMLPDGLDFKLQHNYLNAPIHLVINLNKKEDAIWKFNALLGVSFQKYLRSTIVELNDNEIDQKWVKYRFPNIYGYADAGIEVERIINQKYSLSFNPGYRYQIFNDYRDKGFYGLIKFGRNF